MSNWSRKARRKGVGHPKCCGHRMIWKSTHNAWTCERCGKKRYAMKGTLKDLVEENE